MSKLYKVSIGLLLIGFIVSCGSNDKQAELEKLMKQRDELDSKIKSLESELDTTKNDKRRTSSVQVAEVKKEPFNHFIEVQGRVDGEDNIGVSAQMPGAVTAVYVKEGDRVSKGKVLAQLDNSVLQQQYESAKTQLDFATNVYNKQKALWDQQIGSEMQFLTAKNNMESLQRNVAALNDQLEMTRIKSPINGTVEEINIKVGQMAAPGVPAIRVVNFSTVKVIADIAEAYSSQVKPGAKALVQFPDLNKELETKVHFTSKYINPVNRTFQTEIKLKPGEIDYRANMIAVVKINDYTNPDAIVIPVSLVRETTNGKYVYVAKSASNTFTAQRIPVETGRSYNGMTEIVKGLEVGDKVITTGYNTLVDGQLLKVNN